MSHLHFSAHTLASRPPSRGRIWEPGTAVWWPVEHERLPGVVVRQDGERVTVLGEGWGVWLVRAGELKRR